MGVDGGDGAGGGGQSGPVEALADGLYDGELVDVAGLLGRRAEAGLDGLLDGDCGLSVPAAWPGVQRATVYWTRVGGGYYLYAHSPDQLYGAGVDPGNYRQSGAGGVLHGDVSSALQQGGELGAVLLGVEARHDGAGEVAELAGVYGGDEQPDLALGRNEEVDAAGGVRLRAV